jgi:hypothetical protein
MDAERFGRALGAGTREVAKALLKAADAAAAPNPRAAARPVQPNQSTQSSASNQSTASTASRERVDRESVARTIEQVQAGHARLVEGHARLVAGRSRLVSEGRQAGKRAMAPVTRALGVMWLEITGVFFGIFALAMGAEAWQRRADLTAQGDARLRAWFVLTLAVAFTYFTVTHFVRASRRSRPS